MYWEHFHPFGFFFFLLMVGLLVTNIVMWRRRASYMCFHHRSYDALSALDHRLANGEITIEEYEKVKQILKK
ncbi:SHOCT domain-containing protein [Virgibacillus siamensis]|uniref:SHOCT domain-containing protein n=1 Tax=Virgibacillus siamensis TaxID=480071 RepID=UPI000986424E|nr:SHOCT domain-containing protein [Virgibacillus siamensis]